MADQAFSGGALAVGLAVFVAVLLLMEGVYLLWRQRFGRDARRVQARLALLSGSRERAQAEVLRQRAVESGTVQGWLQGSSALQRLQLLFLQADLAWLAHRVVLASLAGGMLVAALFQLVLRQPLFLAWALGTAVAVMPWVHVLRRRSRRMARMEQQLPDALDLMVRALRAGHAFSSSLKMVADEMPEPMASEFRTVHDEVNFGLSLPQAFGNLVTRVPLTDLRYFVVAVLIQREAGGNLTELLGNLSGLIRARLKLLSKMRVLSSEGRLSGWILVAMPFALGGLMTAFNPEFMRPLWTDPIGISLLQWMLSLMAVGVLLMRKIVRIRV